MAINRLSIAIASAVFALSVDRALASEFEMSIHGHAVEVVKNDDGRILKVDGRDVHSDYYVFVETVSTVAGVPVLVGTSSGGGNACEGAPFVVALNEGAVRLDGPLDTCSPMKPIEEKDRLVFTEPSIPGRDAQSWIWTPDKGFVQQAAVPFKPDSTKGWAELKVDEIGHPADLLAYAPIAAEAEKLLGRDKAEFEEFATGLGSAKRKGGIISGSACIKYDCPENAALLVVDPAGQRAYFAWKAADRKIAVQPPVKQWPDAPRAELREWAATWK